MNRVIRLILLSSLLFNVLNAAPDERNGGPYIGVGYGAAIYNDDHYYNDIKDSSVTSYNFYAGAYINRYLSVELGYIKSGKFHVVSVSSENTTFNYSAITVNALVHYPVLDDSFDFYAKFGAGQSYLNLSSNDGAATVYGAGISYRINNKYALRTGYDMYEFNLDSSSRGIFNMNLQYGYMGIEVQF